MEKKELNSPNGLYVKSTRTDLSLVMIGALVTAFVGFVPVWLYLGSRIDSKADRSDSKLDTVRLELKGDINALRGEVKKDLKELDSKLDALNNNLIEIKTILSNSKQK